MLLTLDDFFFSFYNSTYTYSEMTGRLTQWLECYLHTVEVRGSNPLSPRFFFLRTNTVRMDKILFNPDKMELPPNLLLIPQFWDTSYFDQLKKKARGSFKLITSEILLFDNCSVIVGFLGYPNILTLLEFIQGVKEKEIFFLGTAGSLNPDIGGPVALNVEAIYSTAILDYFSSWKLFPLKPFEPGNLRRAKGVTVDIIQRETDTWLKDQVHRGMDFVEMEIFPLRAYLEKPFTAIVVTTDLLTETGIRVFPDKKRLKKEFVNAYQLIVDTL